MRPDFTKMSVEDLRLLYVEKAGVTMDEAERLKPKSVLTDALMKFYPTPEATPVQIDKPALSIFSVAEFDNNEYRDTIQSELDSIPERGSAEWQEYVISQLREDEYVEKEGKKYPKANGLRRLVEQLLGDIVFSGPVNVFPPSEGNRLNATIVYQVTIRWISDMGKERTFIEVADAGPSNTSEEYACHASATASSRASGRAFRNALQLAIHTAEEMNKSVSGGPTDDIRVLNNNEPIASIQIVGINTMVSRLSLNLVALLKHNNYVELEKLNKTQALDLLAQLNKYSSGELEIPDSIKENK